LAASCFAASSSGLLAVDAAASGAMRLTISGDVVGERREQLAAHLGG
jgi:hypothetical protein